jgi:DNA-directed RNA polymerase subunit L
MITAHPELKYRDNIGIGPQYEPFMYGLFDTMIDPDGNYLSEDWTFCYRWRLMGGKVFADTGIKLDHTGYHKYAGDLEELKSVLTNQASNGGPPPVAAPPKISLNLDDTDDIEINPSDNTMKNSYDIILENEDYTIGKVIEFMLYAKFFEELKTLSYCGFKKMHPHDTDSIIRVAFKETTEKATVKQNLKSCLNDAVTVYKNIMKKF